MAKPPIPPHLVTPASFTNLTSSPVAKLFLDTRDVSPGFIDHADLATRVAAGVKFAVAGVDTKAGADLSSPGLVVLIQNLTGNVKVAVEVRNGFVSQLLN